jgi:hypothetical protein
VSVCPSVRPTCDWTEGRKRGEFSLSLINTNEEVSSLSLTHKHTQDTQSLTHPRSFTCVNGFIYSCLSYDSGYKAILLSMWRAALEKCFRGDGLTYPMSVSLFFIGEILPRRKFQKNSSFQMNWFWRFWIIQSEKQNNESRQISMFGFDCIAII